MTPRFGVGLTAALTIVGRSSPEDAADSVLLVVRDPDTNATHPNVVSVPTARIPSALLPALWPDGETDEFGSTLMRAAEWRSSSAQSGHDPLLHVVSSILSRKLALGDALEARLLTFDAAVVAATEGWAHHEEPDRAHEYLTMLTILVEITSGASAMPARTASYSRVWWAPIGDFVEAASSRDPSRLGLEPLDLCIHGLCIASAHDVLARPAGKPPYARSG